MLILTRRVGECIRIGERLKVRVIAANDERVRISVEEQEVTCPDPCAPCSVDRESSGTAHCAPNGIAV